METNLKFPIYLKYVVDIYQNFNMYFQQVIKYKIKFSFQQTFSCSSNLNEIKFKKSQSISSFFLVSFMKMVIQVIAKCNFHVCQFLKKFEIKMFSFTVWRWEFSIALPIGHWTIHWGGVDTET